VRIASLVPSATEALFALGLGEQVVAVTHECDFPPQATSLPRLTRSVIAPGLAPGEIDRRVRELTGRGAALYELDEEALRRLEPDLIVTQALCAVCAVSYDDSPRQRGQASPARPCATGSYAGPVRCAARWRERGVRGWRRSSGSTRRTPPATGCPR
jgi:hypothetical protein